jgi:hypothetical protein
MSAPKNLKKRNQKRRSKKQSKLSKILSSSKNQYKVKQDLFTDLSPIELLSSLEKIANRPLFAPLINLTSNGDCSSIYDRTTPETELEKSLYWITGLLLHHCDKLNKFLGLEKEVTNAILEENTSHAIDLLNNIDSECGVSTWSIGLRCSILQLSGDPGGVKTFLDQLDAQFTFNDYFKTIRSYVSNRFDSSTLIISSGNSLRNQIQRSIEGSLESFLIYKIVPRNYTQDLKLSFTDILNHEKNSSIIDLFKAVTNFFANAIGTDNFEHNQIAKDVAKKLSQKINCYVINSVCAYYGIEQEWSHDQFTYSMIDQYNSGDYLGVYDSAEGDPRAYSTFTCFELISKSSARVDNTPYEG